MAYRPTISVYIDGQIADLGYYRNWQDEDLFYEALAMAAVFHDCKTIRAYRDRRYGTQKMYYLLDPERIENTQENLKELEACSEHPIVVDLTEQAIYTGYGARSEEELAELLSAQNDGIADGTESVSREPLNAASLLQEDRGISFAHLNMEELLERFRSSEELMGHLSEEMRRQIEKTQDH